MRNISIYFMWIFEFRLQWLPKGSSWSQLGSASAFSIFSHAKHLFWQITDNPVVTQNLLFSSSHFSELKLSCIEKAIQVSIWQCDCWQYVSHKRKPDDQLMQKLLKPTSDKISEIQVTWNISFAGVYKEKYISNCRHLGKRVVGVIFSTTFQPSGVNLFFSASKIQYPILLASLFPLLDGWW